MNTMYDLLICEDEPLILLGLQKIIRGFDLPIHDIFLAEDGIQALQIFNEKNIQLVIADIEMPGLDGLNLLSRMLKAKNELQCIIISGYNKFTYAQTAIKLGIHDYLLKPLDSQELFNALKRCIKKHEQHQSQGKIISTLLCTQIESIWGNLISDQTYKALRSTDMSLFTAPSFVYITFYVDKSNSISLTEAMAKVTAFFAGEFERFMLFPGNTRTFWGVLNIDPEYFLMLEELTAKLDRYLCHCMNTYFMSIYCAIGKPADDIFSLAKTGEEAENALCARLQPNGNRRVFVPVPPVCANPDLESRLNSLIVSLNLHLKFLSISCVENDIEELSQTIERCIPSYAPLIRPFLRMLDLRIIEEVEDEKVSNLLFPCLFKCESIKELKIQFEKNLSQIYHHQIKKKQVCHDAVSHAIDYMERNYAKQLDLTILANIVSMNYTYFSGIFKKKTGMNLISYLQKIRILKAKELLVNTDEKISVIARCTGFNDERYFAKIFKRIEHMTPSEYRISLTIPVKEA